MTSENEFESEKAGEGDMVMVIGHGDGESFIMMPYTISGEEKPACSVGFGQMGKSNMMNFVLNFYVFLI